jgi:LPXTG-motif cell wall-anchored protein
MPRPRSVAILLSAAALAVPAGALGQGTSGAGDDQYTDPLGNGGGSGQTTTGSQTSGSGGSGLSQNPDLGGGSSGTGSPAPAPAPTGTGPATGGLPNTGSDPRLLVLAGLALLLSGLGLRLRTADEDF